MLDKSAEKRRNVIPRWKPIASASPLETGAVGAKLPTDYIAPNWIARAKSAWDFNQSAVNAVDYMDAALFGGSPELIKERATEVIARAGHLSERVVRTAAFLLAGRIRPDLATEAHGIPGALDGARYSGTEGGGEAPSLV